MEHKVSFILTARNELQSVLEATIAGLIETSERSAREIIIIDDGSSVPVGCGQPEVVLLRNNEPLGVARSRRHGAEIASGDVLVWLDAHMTFAPDWLDQMLRHVDSGSLLCSAFWNYEQSVCHCFGADFVWCGKRNYMAQLYPGFRVGHRTQFPGSGAVEIPMIIGACYMMARDSYNKLGGFCPFLRIWGCDEQDLSARAWLSGIGVKCVTEARVGHLDRKSFPYPVQFEDLEFNQMIMLRTVFEESTIAALEQYFGPVPMKVQEWLDQVNWSDWRAMVQSTRQITDAEFLHRFLPDITNALSAK